MKTNGRGGRGLGAGRWAAWIVLSGAMITGAGCESWQFWKSDEAKSNAVTKKTPAKTAAKPAPPFGDVARAYNARVAPLDRVFAWTNLKLTYFDEQGEKRTEDPEGRLQVVRPDKLALSLGKAGTTLFWLGSDSERYWWIDLTDKDKPVAAVGRHALFNDQTARRIGLAIQPLDLIRLLGVVPINVSGTGATQWSEDGKQVGITSTLGNRGFQRIWLDPESLTPQEIELFSKDRQLIARAVHEGVEYVEITRKELPQALGAERARMPSRVFITHFESGTEVRITLTGVKDGRIVDAAFNLDEILRRNGVERVIDLDKDATPRAEGPDAGNPVAASGGR